MIPYKDGLKILDNMENKETKLLMTITKGVVMKKVLKNKQTVQEHSVGFEKIVVIVICLAFLVLLTIRHG